ncbi:hypothetical protein BJX68DRAFT_273064 [Aspergillus pseudodeflectus]|uniref:Uncharacterized protein n=1 Tax=Aspergillus pseudodeflectus TaxID=176178 RepID=A0ABR4JC61_9EURO
MVYNSLHHTIDKTTDLNESNSRIWNLYINSSKHAPLPPYGIHLLCTKKSSSKTSPPRTSSQGNPRSGKQAHDYLSREDSVSGDLDTPRANFHLLADTVSMGNPGASSLPDNEYKAGVSPAKGVLGIEFTPTEKTFVDLAQQLIKVGKGDEWSAGGRVTRCSLLVV